MIIGVERHVIRMILTSDVAWVCSAREIKEHVWHDDGDENGGFGKETDLGPDLRKIQIFGYGHDQ